jgi:hypothetical protein
MNDYTNNILQFAIPAFGGVVCGVGSIGFGLSNIVLDEESELNYFASCLKPYADGLAIMATTGAAITIASIGYRASSEARRFFSSVKNIGESLVDIAETKLGS